MEQPWDNFYLVHSIRHTDPMIRWWYLLTPVFAALDWLQGWSFRVAALEQAGFRAAYYGLLIVCTATVLLRPGSRFWVALLESALNLGLLLIVTVSVLVAAPGQVFAGSAPTVLTLGQLVNFLLVGSVLIYSINHAIWQLRHTGSRP